MKRLRRWASRCTGFLKQRKPDVSAELQFHFDMEVEDGLGRGLTRPEAARQARLKLGSEASARDSYQDQAGLPWLETLLQDARFGLRTLRKNKGFAGTVIVTLALGIGATTAIFTVVNAVLLRPLPYRDAARLVYVSQKSESGVSPFISHKGFNAWQERSRTLSDPAAYINVPANMSGGNEAEYVTAIVATGSLFSILEAKAELGRVLEPGDNRTGAEPVAVLSHSLWQRRFSGSPSVLGRPVTLDGIIYTVVGVMPVGFRVPDRYSFDYDLWLPLREQRAQFANSRIVRVVGRLKAGVSLEQARAELDAILDSVPRRGPARPVVLTPWREEIARGAKQDVLLIMGAVLFVLLIACVNVANLLLARSKSREREMAIRQSIGGSRGRISRQLLTESLLLAVLGGLAGLGVAYAGKDVLLAFLDPNLPAMNDVHLDGVVLGFNLALALLTGLLFGMAPAIHVRAVRLVESLKEAGRSASDGRATHRFRNSLAVAEIALSVVVLCGAGLLLRSFLALRGIDMGYSPGQMLMASTSLTPAKYGKPEDQSRYYTRVVDRLSAIPGVQGVGASSRVPLVWSACSIGRFVLEDAAESTADVTALSVSPGYFHNVGAGLTSGREFRESDPVAAMVNSAYQKKYCPAGNCVGHWLRDPDNKQNRYEIVGVANDIREDLETAAEPEIYRPSNHEPCPSMTFILRSGGDPRGMAGQVRRAFADVDPDQPTNTVMTFDELRGRSLRSRRVNLLLLGSFASLALLLGLIGVYGVISYSVAQRRHEIGVRMAMGARRGQIVGMVLRQSTSLIAAGLVIGLGGSLALERLLKSQIWGVSGRDPWTFAAVAALLLVCGLSAALIPARRASQVNAVVALRCD